MSLLTIDNLHVCYGAISALQGVSAEINDGEIVTLIGSNGAGKTTLLRSISGLLKPRSGQITWQNNQSLIGLQPHQIVRAGISHVPEGRQIFSNLTVRENLLLGAYQQRDRQQIKKDENHSYELFPVLGDRRDQNAGTLSGGEQQMLAIARALMQHPKLLLLDEPSLGLAPLIVRKIFDIIREINRNGTTVFLVEQNAHMALTLAHRAYILQTGQVLKSDQASNLLQDPEVKAAYLGG
ncbi:MAG TPA: ABC transporter ATP-binding protein [Tepidisphaeraceae bacterium]|jgi:branched-chain amino acid transport system ATP-binding protein|nr:ABC transporter ATP-binding protein [Tepidisphaeraceae bacterium]